MFGRERKLAQAIIERRTRALLGQRTLVALAVSLVLGAAGYWIAKQVLAAYPAFDAVVSYRRDQALDRTTSATTLEYFAAYDDQQMEYGIYSRARLKATQSGRFDLAGCALTISERVYVDYEIQFPAGADFKSSRFSDFTRTSHITLGTARWVSIAAGVDDDNVAPGGLTKNAESPRTYNVYISNEDDGAVVTEYFGKIAGETWSPQTPYSSALPFAKLHVRSADHAQVFSEDLVYLNEKCGGTMDRSDVSIAP